MLAIKGSDRRAIPRAAVTRLEWSRGRLGHAVKGLLVGAAMAGAALALLEGE